MRNKKLITLLIVVLVLVVLAIICGATFIVRHVDAYSYYDNPQIEEYDKKIIDASGVKQNSSMFFVDEADIKQKIENAFPDVEVINIKRSFPDKVTINYVIYEKSFQYKNGDQYYQCYLSGKIGSVSDAPSAGYFTIKPSSATSTTIGSFFQSEDGKDRQYIDTIIKFLRSKGLVDFQINRFINFIDFRRDGYVYIRTNAGCSIEIHDNGVDFIELLERGYAVYAKMDPQFTDVVPTRGLIKVYPNLSPTATDSVQCVYLRHNQVEYAGKVYTDEGYYARYYEEASQSA
ncbi:MAG: FtsQ-type POTRA domain-containing protein [Clostridiales bacterium]|nr:FtsQ-type POTRA domain-containing protein [Clostridiales bacterium]